MPDTPSRRLFLAAGPATAVFAALGVAVAAENNADPFLALGRELDAAWAHQAAVDESEDDAAHARAKEIIERIIATPTRSLEGLKLKARALSWCHWGDFHKLYSRNNCTTDFRVVDSILSDLMAMSEATS